MVFVTAMEKSFRYHDPSFFSLFTCQSKYPSEASPKFPDLHEWNYFIGVVKARQIRRENRY